MARKNEIVKNMEFLMKELHKEWDRTGAVKASVVISLDDVEKVKQVLYQEIAQRQAEAEQEDILFCKCIILSHENYILLRLAKKIKSGEEKTNKEGIRCEFVVALDKEERKLYKTLFASEAE